MAKTLTATIDLNLLAEYVDDSDLNPMRGVLNVALEDALANGTAADQANLLVYSSRTLNAASEQLDFAGGLEDPHGATVTFAKIKTLLIRNKNTTAGQILTIGGGTTNPISTIYGSTATNCTETIGANSWCFKHNPVDGFAVTGGLADTLKVDAGTSTVSYDIIAIGNTA